MLYLYQFLRKLRPINALIDRALSCMSHILPLCRVFGVDDTGFPPSQTSFLSEWQPGRDSGDIGYMSGAVSAIGGWGQPNTAERSAHSLRLTEYSGDIYRGRVSENTPLVSHFQVLGSKESPL